jgi:hypothetical protein
MPQADDVTQLMRQHFLHPTVIAEKTIGVWIDRHITFGNAVEGRTIDDARIAQGVECDSADGEEAGTTCGTEVSVTVVEGDRIFRRQRGSHSHRLALRCRPA